MDLPLPQQAASLRRAAPPAPLCALVLSGGIALGAFEAGACAMLEAAGTCRPDWVVGASAGAVNAAILAGNPPERRAERLHTFWAGIAGDPMPWATLFLGRPPAAGAWRRSYNEAAALQTLLFGRRGLFRPRLLPSLGIGAAPALYDLAPLAARLPEFVDFTRLNGGATRVTIAATDLASGERVPFDTAAGTRIGPEHILASCALPPLFAPVEVAGRLLGDGGLVANLPLDLVLGAEGDAPLTCLAVELFARGGQRPGSLAAAFGRAGDIAFGNQTQRILEGLAREGRLRHRLALLAERLPEELRTAPEIAPLLAGAAEGPRPVTLAILEHHAGLDEAGPGKVLDFSPATLEDRWRAGGSAMAEALRRLARPEAGESLAPGLTLHRVAGSPGSPER